MAQRRGYSPFRAGLSNMFSEMSNQMGEMMKDKILTERQAKERGMIEQQQNQQTLLERLKSGDLDPSDIEPNMMKALSTKLGYDVGKLAPTQGERFGKVASSIKPDMGNTQLQALLDAAKVNTGPDQTPLGGMFPSKMTSSPSVGMANNDDSSGESGNPGPSQVVGQFPDATLASRQFGPGAQKPWEQAQQVRAEALKAVQTEAARKAQEMGDIKGSEVTATNAANNANFPNVLNQKKQEITQANDLDVTHQTNLNPVLAKRAGMEETAKNPALIAREHERQRYGNELAKDLEAFKQQNDVTNSTKTMMEGAQMVLPHVTNLRNQAETLDKIGLFGPMMSRVRELAAKAGTVEEFEQSINTDPALQKDRNVGRFATELGLMASGAARVHGGARGGGATMMIQYMKGLLSDAGSLPMFMGRMDALEGYMKGYAAGPHGKQPVLPPIDINPVGKSALEKLQGRR